MVDFLSSQEPEWLISCLHMNLIVDFLIGCLNVRLAIT